VDVGHDSLQALVGLAVIRQAARGLRQPAELLAHRDDLDFLVAEDVAQPPHRFGKGESLAHDGKEIPRQPFDHLLGAAEGAQ
jgi:hypothetical protein